MSIASIGELLRHPRRIRVAHGAVLLAVAALAACSGSNQRQAASVDPSVSQGPAIRPTQPITQVHQNVQSNAPQHANAQPALPKGYTPAAYTPESSVPRVKGVYKVGKPYVINGVTYYPQEDPSYDKMGIASWYGIDFHAKQTANGERFDMNAITAAHPTMPIPSYAYATNLRNGRTLLVRVNDRGPYKPGRIIDLSRQSARLLGFENQGTTEIRVRYAGPAPLDPADDRKERQFLASQPWSRSVGAVSQAPQRPWFGLGGPR